MTVVRNHNRLKQMEEGEPSMNMQFFRIWYLHIPFHAANNVCTFVCETNVPLSAPLFLDDIQTWPHSDPTVMGLQDAGSLPTGTDNVIAFDIPSPGALDRLLRRLEQAATAVISSTAPGAANLEGKHIKLPNGSMGRIEHVDSCTKVCTIRVGDTRAFSGRLIRRHSTELRMARHMLGSWCPSDEDLVAAITAIISRRQNEGLLAPIHPREMASMMLRHFGGEGNSDGRNSWIVGDEHVALLIELHELWGSKLPGSLSGDVEGQNAARLRLQRLRALGDEMIR
eukprot:SAG31_NODE_2600_length_5414_cov_3.077140_2_plen_283_part_00